MRLGTSIDDIVTAATRGIDPIYICTCTKEGVEQLRILPYYRLNFQRLVYSAVRQSRTFVQCGQAANTMVKFPDPSRSCDYSIYGSDPHGTHPFRLPVPSVTLNKAHHTILSSAVSASSTTTSSPGHLFRQLVCLSHHRHPVAERYDRDG